MRPRYPDILFHCSVVIFRGPFPPYAREQCGGVDNTPLVWVDRHIGHSLHWELDNPARAKRIIFLLLSSLLVVRIDNRQSPLPPPGLVVVVDVVLHDLTPSQ